MIDFRGLLHKDIILKFRKQIPLSLSTLTVSVILTSGRNCEHKQNPGHSCRIFMLLPPYWQFTASPLAVHCLHGGRCLPTALAVEKIILYSARFALSLALPKTGGTSGIKIKKGFYFVVRSVCTIFGSAQDRRHLGNKNKKGFLFCSPLGLHYLCPHILIR